jgi:quinohemoprotein ethanol dehydrogenase
MSYNPQTGLVYIPTQDTLFIYSPDKNFKYRPGTWNLGIDFTLFKEPPPTMPGSLLAWDPVNQKERWRVPYKTLWNGGTLTTAGNLVFQGTADGLFVAYSADKGEKLWEATVGTGIIASPVTYEADGVQYVSIMAGWGGAYPLTGGNATGDLPAPGKVLTFSLTGKHQLEPVARRRRSVAVIESGASPEKIEAGANLFAQWCIVCHGIAAAGGGTTADLRYSAAATYDKYVEIVLEGRYQGLGMPSFKRWLTADDVDAIRAYVLKRRAALADKN